MTAEEAEAKATAIIAKYHKKLRPVEQAYSDWLTARKRLVDGNFNGNPLFPELRQRAAAAHDHLCLTVAAYQE